MSITQGGYTPLITAAAFGKCDVVIELLLEGAVVDAQDNVSRYSTTHAYTTPRVTWRGVKAKSKL